MPPTSRLDEIGLRRGAVETADELTVLERAISGLSIPVTDIVMVLEGRWYESANTFAEFLPDCTVHFLHVGADEVDPDLLLANVRRAHLLTSAERREHLRDELSGRPQVIIEHGVHKPARKRVSFRSLFWTLPAGGLYVVEALEPADPDDHESVRRLLDIAGSEPGEQAQPDFEAELSTGASRVELHGALALAYKRTDHLFKLREWEDHAVYERRWGPRWGELLHTEPGYEYAPRSTVRTYGEGPHGDQQRDTIIVPERHLRRQLDVTCFPRRLVTRDRYVLAESFRQPRAKHPTHRQLINTSDDFGRHVRAYTERDVDGELFYFDTAFPSHFGHVTTEQLSHQWGWERAVELNPSIRPIMSADLEGLHPYQRELYTALGIDPDSIELIRHDEAVRVESLITSTPAFVNPHYVDLDMTRVWADLLTALPNRGASRPEKVFVARKAGTPRAAVNRTEIEGLFEEQGFTVIHPEDLSYAEQAHTFAAAKVIAGFAGSGMFSMMFNPDARIILISGDSYIAQNEYLFAATNGNEIHFFWGHSEHKSPDGRFNALAFHSDFELDLQRHRQDLIAAMR